MIPAIGDPVASSGSSREGRVELATVLAFLRPGDELVVTRLDRLGRDTRDVLNLIHECEQREAFVTVLDPHVSTRGAHPTGGATFLLQSYAAVVLGMTCFREGEPNIPGTLVGAVLIAVLANGLTILGVSNDVQDVATGAIILAAVLVRRRSANGG